MISFPNAKINLGLRVVSRREDGYHNLSTLFYPVPVRDVLEIVPSDATKLHTSGNRVDCPAEKNLVMRAVRLMQERYGIGDVDIYLRKIIPDGAGLGGGSADATFTIKMLNDIYSLKIEDDELAAISGVLGADCPFFVYNRPMLAEGTGNIFKEVDFTLSGYSILIVKPDVYVSTREAFARVTPAVPTTCIEEIVTTLPIAEWRGVLVNDFEASVETVFPELAALKERLYEADALYASMSGSGSSYFGIFENDNMAESAGRLFPECRCYLGKL